MSSSLKLKNHQDIVVKQDRTDGRLKVVRQDRKNVEEYNCFIESETDEFKVINLSNFGVLAETKSDQNWDYKEFCLIFENVELGNFRLRVVRSYEDAGRILTAFEIVGDILNIENVETISETHKLVNSHRNFVTQNDDVPDLFARKVYEIKDWLEQLQLLTDQLESERTKIDPNESKSFEHLTSQIIGSYINEFVPSKNSELSHILKGVDAEQMKKCYSFFREKLKNLIYQSPLADRVFKKPLGYAGDFEMMNLIYRSLPEGKTLFAKSLNQYWVKQPGAEAVRNRATYLKLKIEDLIANSPKKDLNFLSVASGPAMEWQKIVAESNTDKNLHIELLDQDEIALKSTQRCFRELNPPSNFNFKYTHKAIKNIIARGMEDRYDMIYSAGLFDYFSGPVAKLACERLYQSLNPGGKLIIGNFNVDNPNSITMDLVLDWNLIYRSESELIELLGIPGSKTYVEKESLNINLFCNIEKP